MAAIIARTLRGPRPRSEHFQTFYRHLPARFWELHQDRLERLGSGEFRHG
jgi:hypothetical protein